jgi:beta-glucanase (GH16 family)
LNLNAISQTNVVDGITYPYLSGLITSTNYGATPLYQFTYGYFEAELTVPASGSEIADWPAWWLNSQNNPTDGEIDIMEGLSGQACSTFHNSAGFQMTCPPGNYSGTHIFAAWWTPGSIAWYYDNKLVGTVTSGVTSSPMYLILNNAIGSAGGPTLVPADTQVKWVHVYSNASGTVPVTPEPGYTGPGGSSNLCN